MKTFIQSYVFIAGIVMMLVGFYIAITPIDYMSTIAGNNMMPSINMLNDLRGMGGMLAIFGVYVFVSAFRRLWLKPALLIASATYSSFVIFRSFGFILDGVPGFEIIMAYSVELMLASIGVLLIRTNAVDRADAVKRICPV